MSKIDDMIMNSVNSKKTFNPLIVTDGLPKGWENKRVLSFDELTQTIETVHRQSLAASVKAVNCIATIRNFVIGFYIVEYEQNGKDRAEYGAKLIKNLAERTKEKGLNETLLKNCRRFYQLYPQVQDLLLGKSPTPSDFSTAVQCLNNLL